MEPSPNTNEPSVRRDTFDRVSDIVKAAILGMAGGAGIASAFGNGLTSAVTGSVLGLIINAAFAWNYPFDWRNRAGVADK